MSCCCVKTSRYAMQWSATNILSGSNVFFFCAIINRVFLINRQIQQRCHLIIPNNIFGEKKNTYEKGKNETSHRWLVHKRLNGFRVWFLWEDCIYFCSSFQSRSGAKKTQLWNDKQNGMFCSCSHLFHFYSHCSYLLEVFSVS